MFLRDAPNAFFCILYLSPYASEFGGCFESRFTAMDTTDELRDCSGDASAIHSGGSDWGCGFGSRSHASVATEEVRAFLFFLPSKGSLQSNSSFDMESLSSASHIISVWNFLCAFCAYEPSFHSNSGCSRHPPVVVQLLRSSVILRSWLKSTERHDAWAMANASATRQVRMKHLLCSGRSNASLLQITRKLVLKM